MVAKPDEQKQREKLIISSLEKSLINKIPMNVIRPFINWLSSPNIELFNSAVYATGTILSSKDVPISKDDISCALLHFDIVYDIIRPGDSVLKNSLYSLMGLLYQYVDCYKPIRCRHEDIFAFEVPMIAHMNSEHFIVITEMHNSQVRYTDMEKEIMMKRDELESQLTGLIAVPYPKRVQGVWFKSLTPEECCYVWG